MKDGRILSEGRKTSRWWKYFLNIRKWIILNLSGWFEDNVRKGVEMGKHVVLKRYVAFKGSNLL